jgi:uncharacterized membrane protein
MEQNQNSWSDFLTDTSQNINNTERVASAIAGGALLAYGMKQGGVGGTLMSILGGGLLLRGTTGHCQIYDAAGIDTAHGRLSTSPFGKSLLSGPIHVTRTTTVNASPAEAYAFWHDLEKLPTFMKHLESVTKIDETRSHWKASAPLGYSVEWDAEITSDVLNERLGWKSVEGSDIANSGVVEFKPTIDRGTEIKVTMTYEAPGGTAGKLFAKLFGEEPGQQVAEDLRRFKSLMETGMIMKVEGQPSGREPLPMKRSAATGGR